MSTTTIYSHFQVSNPGSPGVCEKKQTGQKTHFEIHTLEWLRQNYLLQDEKKERLACYEITWFKSGAGRITVDSNHYEIKNNSVYCFVPGQLRRYHIQDNTDGYRLSFSADFLCINTIQSRIVTWLDSLGSDGTVAVLEADADMQREMEDITRRMENEFVNYYLLRSEILAGLLNILIIYFSRKLQVTTTDMFVSKDKELVRRFKALLRTHFVTKKLVADYAGELCVTPNYLNRTVKKITGFTASHHIQQHIIFEAKKQAAHFNVSMKEIAYYLGFDNLAHFSKFFKNNSGMNFTSFKKTMEAA
jgi:AraC family transcriptional regulator, transcriptional activator of pobA